MLAGFSRVDITPPMCIPYLSYVPRQTPFEGVHDPLHARALVLAEGDARLVIISADSLGYSNDVLGPDRHFTEEVRARVARRTGISPECVMLATNHVHSTPQTTNVAHLLDFAEAGPWLETLMEQLASAAVRAHHALRPAELRAGLGAAPGIAHNRRCAIAASAPVDDALAGLLVQGEGWRGCLINFTCHPVTVQVNPLVSADYPGAACAVVERVLGAEACVFLQGACGDLNPIRDTSDFEDVERYGLMLGGQALYLMACLSALEPLAPVLRARSRSVELPPYEYPPEEQPFADEVAKQEEALAKAATREEYARAYGALRVARDRLQMIRRGPVPVLAEVQALRIGDVGIVSVPGELFCALGLEIKRRSPAPLTMVSAYTNGYEGYFPTAAAYEEGGYETSIAPWCRVGPQAGALLVDTAVALLRELWAEEAEQPDSGADRQEK
ncbi:MAG: neutral/alkaline non-lysosomal ceramidase N-terminal domain-containing protein [Armatimonadetes bacterium]|nr:neutral/alkaline non-lysosomal ceramidase N-terminal domain-containing protein [Armatimonadota bacterium]